MQDSRRATRLVKRQSTKLQLYQGHLYNPAVSTLEQTTSMDHAVMSGIYDR